MSKDKAKLIYNKQSFHHPLINQRLFNDKFGFFTVEKVFNQKYYIPYAEFNYEKDNPHINWEWIVHIKTDAGVELVVPILDIIKDTTTSDGKLLNDTNLFIFYE